MDHVKIIADQVTIAEDVGATIYVNILMTVAQIIMIYVLLIQLYQIQLF
jgi:hypothetical protein